MGQKIKRVGYALVRQKYLWTILIFIVIVGFAAPNSFMALHKLRTENNRLKAEIVEYEKRYEADTKALEELETNPEAVERVARVNLYMKTADEDVYVIE